MRCSRLRLGRGGERPIDPIVDSARRQLVRLGLAMAVVNLLLPLGLWVVADATGAEYWEMFAGEENAVTWFSSVQLLLLAAVAWGNRRVAELLAASPGRPRTAIWTFFALGFVFLSIDERFELHERLRDELLAPAGVATDVGFLEPGDLGLYAILAVGLVATAFLVRELRERPLALGLFASGVVLAAAVTVTDSVRGEIAYAWRHGWFWNYVFEETGELWAQLLFLLAFLLLLHDRLTRLLGERHAGEAP
jgi:hypothetical protein